MQQGEEDLKEIKELAESLANEDTRIWVMLDCERGSEEMDGTYKDIVHVKETIADGSKEGYDFRVAKHADAHMVLEYISRILGNVKVNLDGNLITKMGQKRLQLMVRRMNIVYDDQKELVKLKEIVESMQNPSFTFAVMLNAPRNAGALLANKDVAVLLGDGHREIVVAEGADAEQTAKTIYDAMTLDMDVSQSLSSDDLSALHMNWLRLIGKKNERRRLETKIESLEKEIKIIDRTLEIIQQSGAITEDEWKKVIFEVKYIPLIEMAI
jgi:hypothetical protein